MTRYEIGFLSKCAEYGVDRGTANGLVKRALFHWTHHLVPWETPVEVHRKARRAIFAAENGHPGVARKIMKSKYKDPQMESLLDWMRDVVKRQNETQAKLKELKQTGVWPKSVEGNPFKGK